MRIRLCLMSRGMNLFFDVIPEPDPTEPNRRARVTEAEALPEEYHPEAKNSESNVIPLVVLLTNGKLVTNCPSSMAVFRPSPYITPQDEIEFVNQRFSVITGALRRLPNQYTIRPKTFHPPRPIKTLFTIDGIQRLRGGIDLSLRFATTLNSVISGISDITYSRRADTWKKCVVCLILRQINSEELISLLWRMGFRSFIEGHKAAVLFRS
jgi:hypothetical protein